MTPTNRSTPRSPISDHSVTSIHNQIQAQYLQENQPTPTPDPNSNSTSTTDVQFLHAALSRKQKQLLAAREGHVNIAIEPLEKQIRLLEELLEGLERDEHKDGNMSQGVGVGVGKDGIKGVDAGTEWVVLPARLGKTDKEKNEVEGCEESGEKVVRQGDDVRMHAPERDLDHEKILGTWI